MWSDDLLGALDRLPTAEALQRPLHPEVRAESRIAAMLTGSAATAEAPTLGDMLFTWSRTEPEALRDADVPDLQRLSHLVASSGRLPRRLGMAADAERALSSAWQRQRAYLLARMGAQFSDAQGYESIVSDDATDADVTVNGLNFAVLDPAAGVPGHIERLTMLAQDHLAAANDKLQFAYSLGDLSSGMIGNLLPEPGSVRDSFGAGLRIAQDVQCAARLGRLLTQHDTESLLSFLSVVSDHAMNTAAGVLGQKAAVLALGAAGGYVVVLAPLAVSLAGQVVGRNILRRARYAVFCKGAIDALNQAISAHALACRDQLRGNVSQAAPRTEHLRGLRGRASGVAALVLDDWLDRTHYIQSYRNLIIGRLERALADPKNLDHRDGDPLAAAFEVVAMGARAGVHPANVDRTSKAVVAASETLHRQMRRFAI